MAGSSRPIVFQTIGLPVRIVPTLHIIIVDFNFGLVLAEGRQRMRMPLIPLLLFCPKDNSVPIWEIVFAKLVRIAPIFPALLTKDVLLPAFPTAFL